MSWITGVGMTSFGRHQDSDTLSLMSEAAIAALKDAGLERRQIDGLICGYSTTHPHLMLSTVFAEHFGLMPSIAHAMQLGGATGLAMLMLASELVLSGAAEHVLVVAGENRLSGQSSVDTLRSLAQVGHPTYEVPLGPTIPAYYALVASRYMHKYGVTEEDLAEHAVVMRSHAVNHPGAHHKQLIGLSDVMSSRVIASPLKLLDCCPVSDGGAAFVVSRERTGDIGVQVIGCAQAHTHQHVSAARDLTQFGASRSLEQAVAKSGATVADADYFAIYDSFTITLTILLEELGIAPRGEAGKMAREGWFGRDGRFPLNTHGGLLSYGHCGCAGAMAHLVEAQLQLTGRAEGRQVKSPTVALLHGDGGVLSSHVTAFLERVR
ncbi:MULTISPECIES: thiolase family protein [unclassified Pigmentiphaga]|uniref:thiolase family protein n=1 Tax=unclassified Pigmentiphaga TaxID=2626614 RepID=UPI000B421D9D|nr:MULTISPECIES: thiolase family protein [unclassified Pigmentiphaga]OVZ65603.1 thiolase [Pigmentiphaga sp. NML030171]